MRLEDAQAAGYATSRWSKSYARAWDQLPDLQIVPAYATFSPKGRGFLGAQSLRIELVETHFADPYSYPILDLRPPKKWWEPHVSYEIHPDTWWKRKALPEWDLVTNIGAFLLPTRVLVRTS